MVTPDGMPLVWSLKWSGLRHMNNIYGPDLMLAAFGADQLTGMRAILLWYDRADTCRELRAGCSAF